MADANGPFVYRVPLVTGMHSNHRFHLTLTHDHHAKNERQLMVKLANINPMC